jgi:hypothetical protein
MLPVTVNTLLQTATLNPDPDRNRRVIVKRVLQNEPDRRCSSIPTHTSHSRTPDIMDASKLLQLQTAAAHNLTRPQTQSHQHQTSPTSDSASSSETALPQLVYCSRCQRQSFSTDGMVCFAVNSYYCNRCASLVGYGG